MAKISERFQDAVTHLMRTKFHIHEKTIRIEQVHQDNIKNAIFLSDIATILEFLQYFGDIIPRIYYSGMFYSGEERLQINQYIAKYCARTLLELELIDADSYLIRDTSDLFPTVSRLNVQNFEYTDNLALNRIYPNLTSLTICSYDFPLKSLVDFYPKLMHLSTSRTDESIVLEVVLSNPQLRRFDFLDVPTVQFIEHINQALPQLESLEVKHNPDGFLGPTDIAESLVHFKNVQHFGLNADGFEEITVERVPFSFGQLKSLKIGALTADSLYSQLIQDNDQIEVLTLERINDVDILPLIAEYVSELHSLRELSVSWMDDVDESDVFDLVNTMHHLKKVILDFWIEFDCDHLVPRFAPKWHVQNEYFSMDSCMLTLEAWNLVSPTFVGFCISL